MGNASGKSLVTVNSILFSYLPSLQVSHQFVRYIDDDVVLKSLNYANTLIEWTTLHIHP